MTTTTCLEPTNCPDFITGMPCNTCAEEAEEARLSDEDHRDYLDSIRD